MSPSRRAADRAVAGEGIGEGGEATGREVGVASQVW
jgi:hypothetical protein